MDVKSIALPPITQVFPHEDVVRLVAGKHLGAASAIRFARCCAAFWRATKEMPLGLSELPPFRDPAALLDVLDHCHYSMRDLRLDLSKFHDTEASIDLDSLVALACKHDEVCEKKRTPPDRTLAH